MRLQIALAIVAFPSSRELPHWVNVAEADHVALYDGTGGSLFRTRNLLAGDIVTEEGSSEGAGVPECLTCLYAGSVSRPPLVQSDRLEDFSWDRTEARSQC